METGGPYTPVTDSEGLQVGAVYYRRGTKNDRALSSELKRIFNWFTGNNNILRRARGGHLATILRSCSPFRSGKDLLTGC